MKINKNKKILWIFLTIIVIVIAISVNIMESSSSNLALKNDFYDYINNDFLENKTLNDDESSWTYFSEMQESINNNVTEIVDKIVKEDKDSNIAKLYNSVINVQDDLSILDNYIQKIENSENINELIDVLSKTSEDLSIPLIVTATVEEDYINNEETIINLYPFTYDFGMINSDYYKNPIYSDYVGTFIKYNRKLLELYGYTKEEAKESVTKVVKFYIDVANQNHMNT